MNEVLIYVLILLAFAASSIWESSIEGKYGGAAKAKGWRLKYKGFTFMTRYHFFLWWVTVPLFLAVIWVAGGMGIELAKLLISAFFLGIVIEDFLWFVFNEEFTLRKFNEKNVKWIKPWIKIGKIQFPAGYILLVGLAVFFLF